MPKKVRRGFNFNTMEFKAPNYSRFNLSHDRLQTLQAGKLTPLWWTEMLPGDVFTVKYSGFMRLLALSSPMLQREDIFIRAFFVPFRILANQDDVDKLFAGSKNGTHLDTPFLSCSPTYMDVGTLYDHLELPLPYSLNNLGAWVKNTDADVEMEVSAFPFLAYQRIYHDHFRNEETQDDYLDSFKCHFDAIDGSDAHGYDPDGEFQYDQLQSVCWERTYLTSALASSQRGNQVNIPLIGTAPVKPDSTTAPSLEPTPGAQAPLELFKTAGGGFTTDDTGESEPLKWSKTGMVVDGSSFTGIGAIALRLAMNLQAFMERNNIAGYRMIGNTLAHFGVYSSNKLQDEAQYLGGIKAPITISAVTQTSATQLQTGLKSTPQGTQVGQGMSSFSDILFSNFRTEERGILMIVGYVNAKESTSQGLARKWTRRSYLDYYWPEFQTIGEQEILNQEVYFEFEQVRQTEGNENDTTWAYQSRYSEYKYEGDSVGGDFRTSLSYWHQSRLWNQLPKFNDSFVKSNPSDRVFAVNTTTYPRPYLLESYFEVDTVRPMSKYAQSKLW